MAQQSIALCAFCGKPSVTAEHVFADWLKQLFPPKPGDEKHTKHVRFRAFTKKIAPGEIVTEKIPQIKQGHAFTLTTRKVCTACNTGWMSKLEAAVKPILVPLMRKEHFILDSRSQLGACRMDY